MMKSRRFGAGISGVVSWRIAFSAVLGVPAVVACCLVACSEPALPRAADTPREAKPLEVSEPHAVGSATSPAAAKTTGHCQNATWVEAEVYAETENETIIGDELTFDFDSRTYTLPSSSWYDDEPGYDPPSEHVVLTPGNPLTVEDQTLPEPTYCLAFYRIHWVRVESVSGPSLIIEVPGLQETFTVDVLGDAEETKRVWWRFDRSLLQLDVARQDDEGWLAISVSAFGSEPSGWAAGTKYPVPLASADALPGRWIAEIGKGVANKSKVYSCLEKLKIWGHALSLKPSCGAPGAVVDSGAVSHLLLANVWPRVSKRGGWREGHYRPGSPPMPVGVSAAWLKKRMTDQTCGELDAALTRWSCANKNGGACDDLREVKGALCSQ